MEKSKDVQVKLLIRLGMHLYYYWLSGSETPMPSSIHDEKPSTWEGPSVGAAALQ